MEPEEMLVLETIGSVEEFARALKDLPGLEWLGDFDVEGIEPDEDFYSETDAESRLSGRVYLVMSNQRGLRELRRLWEVYRANSEHPAFERGQTKWRDLFRLLKDVRPWGPEDRLRATGFSEELTDLVAAGQDVVATEVELWYRQADGARVTAEAAVRRMIEEANGRVVANAVISQIGYHGVLAELSVDAAAQIVRDEGSALVRAAQVLKIRPVGQALTEPTEGESVQQRWGGGSAPTGDPIVALLDGLPMQRHERLADRLIVDDPDGYEAGYAAGSRVHGTAMASLILHGDLALGGRPLARPLYVRPILRPDPRDMGTRDEGVPDDVLPVDLVRRAIERLFRAPEGETPAAPSVRIVTHAVADPRRVFEYSMSAWARVLDYLAFEHQVLIVTTAGNVDLPVKINAGAGDPAIQAMRELTRSPWARRLIAPGESINAITMGSTHDDAYDGPLETGAVDLFTRGALSPYSRHGPGYRRSTKPDAVHPGGRITYRFDSADGAGSTQYATRKRTTAPGQIVAAPDDAGRLDRTWSLRGTSNSTALATRAAAEIFEMVDGLRAGPGGERLERRFESVLVKALLVHSVNGSAGLLDEVIADPTERQKVRARLIGYGRLEPARVLASTDSRVTLLGWGVLVDGSAHQYEIPLPPSLSGVHEARRVTITLAWMAPVNPRHSAYRRASLWFDPYGARDSDDNLMRALGLVREDGDYRRPRRGTVQHEVFVGSRAAVFEEGRRAIVQVNCRSETDDLGTKQIPYGLAVTVETSDAIRIYEEIRSRIRPPVPVGVAAATD